MFIKIYFNTTPLYLATEVTGEIIEYTDSENVLVERELSTEKMKQMIDAVENGKMVAGIYLHNNLDELFAAFTKHFEVIQAAGGAVLNKKGEMLFIFRRGKWDLPKGKLDEGENLDACAVREVQEETGLEQIDLKKFLCVTYHTYHERGSSVLKESHWYLMQTTDADLVPQTEEDIEKCEWVKLDKIAPYLEDTHLSIVDVVKAALKNLEK